MTLPAERGPRCPFCQDGTRMEPADKGPDIEAWTCPKCSACYQRGMDQDIIDNLNESASRALEQTKIRKGQGGKQGGRRRAQKKAVFRKWYER